MELECGKELSQGGGPYLCHSQLKSQIGNGLCSGVGDAALNEEFGIIRSRDFENGVDGAFGDGDFCGLIRKCGAKFPFVVDGGRCWCYC